MELDSIDYLATTFERSGWAPASARDRQIEDGSQFDKYFSPPRLSKECIKRNGSVEDTVALMQRIIKSKYNQVEQLAINELAVKGEDGKLNVRATVENIFNFIFKYLKYNLEKGEQLKSPRRTWYSAQVLARQKTDRNNSADCDCFSIFAGSCMYALRIPFALRIAGYQGDGFQHVYCVAYDGGKSIICDPVTNRFDWEKPPVNSKTFPVNINTMSGLSGTDIYVLDGIDAVGDLGKSAKKAAKKAAKAEKKQAKLEKKAEKKQAKLEKKAEKREAKAEKKAEKKIAKAEKKAEKLERKAEKKGGAKAEKLKEKAQAVRESAQVKADAIKDKAQQKSEDRAKTVSENLAKKQSRLDIRNAKRTGASKEEIKELKKKKKDLKKEIKQARKEDGRGAMRKAVNSTKKFAMTPVRTAFLGLMRLNFRGMATGFCKSSQAYSKFLTKWKKIFGGSEAEFKSAITRGQVNKPLFGSSRLMRNAEQLAKEKGYDNLDNFETSDGQVGDLGDGGTAEISLAIASAAISLAAGILKMCGVDVPEDIDDAADKLKDISEMFADDEQGDGQKQNRALDIINEGREIVDEITELTTEKEIDPPGNSNNKQNMEEKDNKPQSEGEKDNKALKATLIVGGLALLAFAGYKIFSSGDDKASNTSKKGKLGLVPLS